MTMHTSTDTFFERCVTAFLSRLDFFGLPGNLTDLLCFKAERVCVLPFLYSCDGKARGFAHSKAVKARARKNNLPLISRLKSS